MGLKKVIKSIIPRFLLKRLKKGRPQVREQSTPVKAENDQNPKEQNLVLYWDPEYAKVLDEWGKDSTWNEIQLLLCTSSGKVLDIACGTGITIEILSKFRNLDLYGFDISELLIEKAVERGIDRSKLKVADATKSNYAENEFDYSYSIGSLEHFTEEGIEKFIEQSSKITKRASFHMIPVSRSNLNEGWMTTVQSFFNNSEDWWKSKFEANYDEVYPVPSKWEDDISFGRWFICVNNTMN